VLVFLAVLLTATGGSFVGPAQRSAALCPEGMVYVPQGAFRAGATGDEVGLSDYVPDIVRDPRPRGTFETGRFCIDQTEWQRSAIPSFAPGPDAKKPVADVTWVQARVACALVGKRLCSEDEWAKACGGVLGWLRPYGPRPVVGLCHADVQEEGQYHLVVPAGSLQTCRSPYGTFDQEGNVSEWVEDRGDAERGDRWVLGGTMWPGVYGAGCQARHGHPEVAPVAGDDGFRCCQEAGR
jgi:formylglycine-generating enzyme required for sulfatase activity